MKASRHILIFDSGFGGLSVLKGLRKRFPSARFSYCFDNEYFPYGARDARALNDRVLKVTSKFVKLCRPDLLVIACNTASIVCLEGLRSHFGFPVVGVVPAIKPAAKRTRSGNIALLATPATVKSPYTDQLIADFAKSCRIIKKPTMKLVELAERKIAGENVLGPCRMELADISAMAEIDVVVLACTHFIHLREELQEIFSKSTELLDPVNAIVDRVIYLLGEESSAYDSLDECDVLSFATTNYLENLKSEVYSLQQWGITHVQAVKVD